MGERWRMEQKNLCWMVVGHVEMRARKTGVDVTHRPSHTALFLTSSPLVLFPPCAK